MNESKSKIVPRLMNEFRVWDSTKHQERKSDRQKVSEVQSELTLGIASIGQNELESERQYLMMRTNQRSTNGSWGPNESNSMIATMERE